MNDVLKELKETVGRHNTLYQDWSRTMTDAAAEIEALRARLEKAEASCAWLFEQTASARNDALEEAAAFVLAHSALSESVAEGQMSIGVSSDPPLTPEGAEELHAKAIAIRANARSMGTIATAIRALKDKP
jgi:hypothetical protein